MNIKLQKAKKLADTGAYHQTWNSILAAMPDSLKERCTAMEVAMIADAMRNQYLKGHAAGIQEY